MSATGGVAGGAGAASTGGAGGANAGGAGGAAANAGGVGGAGGASAFDCTLPDPTGGPTIAHNTPSGNPPAMIGGPITDGVYFQVSEDDYNGQSVEAAVHRVAVYDQVKHRFAMNASDSAGHTGSAGAGTITVSATSFTLDSLPCTTPESTLTISYTATATTITWVDPNHSNRLMNFALQQ